MPFTTSRMFTVRGWPLGLAWGTRGFKMAHSASVRSLGYLFLSCSMTLPSHHYPSLHDTYFSNILLLILAQRTKGREFPDLVVLAPWKGPCQAKLPIGGRVTACGPGNFTRRVGSNMRSPMPWE